MGKGKIKVVVIGGGISGIASGIRLSEALGSRLDLTILEKGASPGGVWRDSKWPGAGVDVPIHLYSLYSDLNPEWDSVFASQPEVLAYWEGLVDKHELRDTFLFHNEFVGSDWDAATQTHTVHVRNANTGARTKLTANVLISAAGPLAKPLLPSIPGIESFQGAYFHNLRWDSSVPLEGKRIAVIGNGSSGIQLIVRRREAALTPARRRGPPRRPAHPLHPLGRVLCAQACVYHPAKLTPAQRKYTEWEKFAFRWIPGWIHWNRYALLREHDAQWALRNLGRDPSRQREEAELLAYLREKTPAEYLDALTPHYRKVFHVTADPSARDQAHGPRPGLARQPAPRQRGPRARPHHGDPAGGHRDGRRGAGARRDHLRDGVGRAERRRRREQGRARRGRP